MTDVQESATDLIDRIESTLAVLDLVAAQARDNIEISTDRDVNRLQSVADALEDAEDIWSGIK